MNAVEIFYKLMIKVSYNLAANFAFKCTHTHLSTPTENYLFSVILSNELSFNYLICSSNVLSFCDGVSSACFKFF